MTPSARHTSAGPSRRARSGERGPDLEFARTERLRYQRPELPSLDEVARYYAVSEETRIYSNGGPCHEHLALRMADYIGDVSCVPVGNCTLGLMAALRVVCGEPEANRNLIAVPSFTFTATACAIRWAGFEPLFVDVDPDSWQLDPAALEEAVKRHGASVAGVMGCSTFGTPAPHAIRQGWREVCARHGLSGRLLIDSAAGFGAVDENGRPLGSLGETEIFSFHATKPFAIGEGGVVVTPHDEVAEALTRMINFGIDPDSRLSLVAGINAKMSELAAATGLAMLDRFQQTLARRRATAARLQSRLAGCRLTYQKGSAGSTWQVFQVLMPDADTRQRGLELAEAHRIEVRTCFDPPLHRHPAFIGSPAGGSLAVTERLAARALSLPMANTLGPRQIARLGGLMDAVLEGAPC